MYIRPCYRRKNGKRHAYWALVECYRTPCGPRQRTVAYLGQLDEPVRLGVCRAAGGNAAGRQLVFFDDVEPQWVEVDVSRVRFERTRSFGGEWLGLQLIRQLSLDKFLADMLPQGREDVPWAMMALVLVLCRLTNPSSELHIAEHYYEHSALEDLLGIPAERVNEDRLYRALDMLLPHKAELEVHLKGRLGTLFGIGYDLLLYDVTSTYFEGEAAANPQAKRGYSRDHRPECKQVCIALIVSRCGMPLGYEVFAGNRNDVTTVKEIVELMESRYGKADRVWVMDRGMVSEKNIEFLKEGGRRYIIGTPKSELKKFERELLDQNWEIVRDGIEVKLCPSPDGDETFILCRSSERREKDKAIFERFEKRIEEGLKKIEASCRSKKQKPATIAARLGRLLGRNSRAAKLFQAKVTGDEHTGAQITWSKYETQRDWALATAGCYILRSNVAHWSGDDLWHAYIQLTEAESAFRIHKGDLRIRPIWHQKEHRVQAHILVCFLAYVLWKTLGQLCRAAGLGDEPRRVFDEIGKIQAADILLPTRQGVTIRKRCVAEPTEHQAILLQRLGLNLPKHLSVLPM